MARQLEVITWNKIGKVRIKKMFGKIDPTDDMRIMVKNLVMDARKKHNQTVANTFDLPEGEFTKYEFMWTSPAYVITEVESAGVGAADLFKMDIKTTLIYAKPQSLLLFQTDYEACIKKGCGGGNYGTVCYAGGTKFELEEIFYKKITSLQATHNEKQYHIISKGCFGKPAVKTEVIDGFKIRSGENFEVIDNNPNELQACRKDINERVQKLQ